MQDKAHGRHNCDDRRDADQIVVTRRGDRARERYRDHESDRRDGSEPRKRPDRQRCLKSPDAV